MTSPLSFKAWLLSEGIVYDDLTEEQRISWAVAHDKYLLPVGVCTTSGGVGVVDAGPLRINVTHFQSKVTKRIPLLSTSFLAFFARVQREFEVELHGQESIIYRFPTLVTGIESRVKIDSQKAYENMQKEFSRSDTSRPLPTILVWSMDPEDCGCSSATSGRAQSVSEMCKLGEAFTCMACKYVCDKIKRQYHASQILEVKEYANLSEEQHQAVLDECQLIAVDELSNHITLCDVCHDYFDHQRLCIGIAEDGCNYMWIVKDDAMDCVIPAGGTYGEIVHHKALTFEYPQQNLHLDW